MLIQQWDLDYQGVTYEFNVPVEQPRGGHGNGGGGVLVPQTIFLWEYDDWTPCSKSCAGGTSRRPAVCRRLDDNTVVQNKYCDQRMKLYEQEIACNQDPCPAT